MNLNIVGILADMGATLHCSRGRDGWLVIQVDRRDYRVARRFDTVELCRRPADDFDREILEMLDELRRETP